MRVFKAKGRFFWGGREGVHSGCLGFMRVRRRRVEKRREETDSTVPGKMRLEETY